MIYRGQSGLHMLSSDNDLDQRLGACARAASQLHLAGWRAKFDLHLGRFCSFTTPEAFLEVLAKAAARKWALAKQQRNQQARQRGEQAPRAARRVQTSLLAAAAAAAMNLIVDQPAGRPQHPLAHLLLGAWLAWKRRKCSQR